MAVPALPSLPFSWQPSPADPLPADPSTVLDPLIAADPQLLVERAASLLARESADWQVRRLSSRHSLG